MPTDKVKQNLEGKTALDIFSTQLFIYEIKKYAKELNLNLNNIEEKMLPQYLNESLESEDLSVKETAEKITKKFGERLGVILLTLKKGQKENRIKREDWSDTHWEYWNTIENVILVGGLASSKVGERLKYYVQRVFEDSGTKCYKIILNKDSANIGIKGSATYIKNANPDTPYLIFDFGQTFMKRSIVKIENRQVKNIENLDKVLSSNVAWEFESIEEEKQEAYKSHKNILNTILDTVKEAENHVGDTIVISIANYVRNGVFANRGGYGKLRLITDNY